MFRSLYLTFICLLAIATIVNAQTSSETKENTDSTTPQQSNSLDTNKETERHDGINYNNGEKKQKMTIIEIKLFALIIIVVILVVVLIVFGLKIKNIKAEIAAASTTDDVIEKIKKEILKDYVKTTVCDKKVFDYKAVFTSKCNELEKTSNETINKIKNLEDSIENINAKLAEYKKIKELEKSSSRPSDLTQDSRLVFSSTPFNNLNSETFVEPKQESLIKEKPRIFWVGVPQNGIFNENEGVYKFYKCETIPGEDRAKFDFNEDPSFKRFFEDESKCIYNLAEISGIVDERHSIINLKSGFLKKNPHGEGWILEKKAKIKFS